MKNEINYIASLVSDLVDSRVVINVFKTPTALPRIALMDDGSDFIRWDGLLGLEIANISLELYFKDKDFELENKIIERLNKQNLKVNVGPDNYLSTEGIYLKVYDIEIIKQQKGLKNE